MSDMMDEIFGVVAAANASFAAGVKAAGDFNAGVRASDDAANLCARKLRVALAALQIIAMPAGAGANLESEMERATRLAAKTALDRIGELK